MHHFSYREKDILIRQHFLARLAVPYLALYGGSDFHDKVLLDSPEPSGGNMFTSLVPGGANVHLRAPSAPSAPEVSGGLRSTHGFC